MKITFLIHILALLAWLTSGILHAIKGNSVLTLICGITTGVEISHVIYQAFRLKDDSKAPNKKE